MIFRVIVIGWSGWRCRRLGMKSKMDFGTFVHESVGYDLPRTLISLDSDVSVSDQLQGLSREPTMDGHAGLCEAMF